MILVTGATGNVGKVLVQQLLEKGARTRILVRDPQRAAGLAGKVEFAVGDLDKPETLADAVKGVEQLYFVTAQTQQVRHLLEAAQHAGVKHVVKQSTIEADCSLGPGKWHRQQEQLIQSMGFEWTILRPTLMMVNTIQWWAETIKSQNAVYFPGGKGKVPPVDPQDVAAVASVVLTEPGYIGRIFDITGPESLTIGEMVEILAKVIGRPIKYTDVPVFAAGIAMLRYGTSLNLAYHLMQTLGALRRSEYAYVTDVVEQVGRVKPRTFEEWCHDNISAFQ
jgi:uncharacterized protein YbjT (DUF2867 family)